MLAGGIVETLFSVVVVERSFSRHCFRSPAVDDLRVLLVPGRISVRVHPAAPENSAGFSEVVDHSLLRPRVITIPLQMYFLALCK